MSDCDPQVLYVLRRIENTLADMERKLRKMEKKLKEIDGTTADIYAEVS